MDGYIHGGKHDMTIKVEALPIRFPSQADRFPLLSPGYGGSGSEGG